MNGDGLDDLIVGAYHADPGVASEAGETYVVFGKADTVAIELGAVAAGTGGFVIRGIDPFDWSGISVSAAGDVNGDGLGDLIVGAMFADGMSVDSGQGYVIFGKSDTSAVNLADIVLGIGGFAINGFVTGDWSGFSVSGAGDVNGDGRDDLIVGGYPAFLGFGLSHVVFGKSSTGAVDLADIENGIGGFVIVGIASEDFSGRSVSGAGDVNGDGLDDLIIGADGADRAIDIETLVADTGESYVVFGKTGTTAVFLLDVYAGFGGFAIEGRNTGDLQGWSVSTAGDVNGDGLADLIVGAPLADTGSNDAGESYVVFGKLDTQIVQVSDLETGTGGFLLLGIDPADQSGISVSEAGDVNGDGLDDLVIGANGADVATNSRAGEAYLVLGKADSAAVDLFNVSLNLEGYALSGIDADDEAGVSVSAAGDVNGDGFADFIVGADKADPGGRLQSGETYVVFGDTALPAVWTNFAHTGVETGGFVRPFNSLGEALMTAPPGGVVKIKGNAPVTSTGETFVIDQAVRIEAVWGSVHIGAGD